MGVIWLLSSGAKTPGPPLPHPLDWAAHFLAYLALGFCLGKATGRPQIAWVLAAWFGALDEVHQAFVPPREAGIVDWIFDLSGSLLGARLAARTTSTPNTSAETATVDLHFEQHFAPHLDEQPHDKLPAKGSPDRYSLS